ncbi:MAG: prolipoprotein diacylglyceryl transferase [Patescibacteria group bacterium]
MIPTVFPFQHGSFIVINSFTVVGWLIFSFLFWRSLRRFAVDEDRVFDLTFFATIVAFIFARMGYVVAHPELFLGKSFLLIAAIWVAPGFSWLAGFIGGVATLVVLSRQYKVRLGLVLDALAVSLPLPIIIGKAGSLLTGMEAGKIVAAPWLGNVIRGVTSFRHPVQLYEMLALLCISMLCLRMTTRSIKEKWPYGLVGLWFFFWYAVTGFVLEFAKDSRVYWGSLTANQWMLIGIFAECVGVLYVRGGGRERVRPIFYKVLKFFEEKGKKIHESIPSRHTH